MEMSCLLQQYEELHTKSPSHSLRDHLCCSKRSWTAILFLKNSDIYHDLLSLCMYRIIDFGFILRMAYLIGGKQKSGKDCLCKDVDLVGRKQYVLEIGVLCLH